MKLSDEWFRSTQIHEKHKDVYDIGFYSGMQAAMNLIVAKGSVESAEIIRQEIARDTDKDP